MWVVIRRRLGYHPLTKPRDPTRANQLGNACSRGQDADSGVCTEYMPFTPYMLCIAALAIVALCASCFPLDQVTGPPTTASSRRMHIPAASWWIVYICMVLGLLDLQPWTGQPSAEFHLCHLCACGWMPRSNNNNGRATCCVATSTLG